jgi:hypothetical protein
LSPRPQTDEDVEFRRSLLLVSQVALLGEVSGVVRGVTLGWTKSEITLRAIVDGPVEADDRESMGCVGSEILASFPAHAISVEVVRVDAPASVKTHCLRVWVFLRKEQGSVPPRHEVETPPG